MSADSETLCSTRVVGSDDQGNRAVEREIYSFPKINQQLAKYPELARAVGLDHVRTCADARIFAERYYRYTLANPDFVGADRPKKGDFLLR